MRFVRFQIQVIAKPQIALVFCVLFTHLFLYQMLFGQQIMKQFAEHKGNANWNHAIK